MTGDWRTWLMIGAVGFGGPAGQVAILHRELVERRRWLDEDEFLAALRLCMLLPGPLILVVTFIGFMAGWKAVPDAALQAGLAGASTATLFAFLPAASICSPSP